MRHSSAILLTIFAAAAAGCGRTDGSSNAPVPPMPLELYLDPSEALEATTGYRLLQSNVRAAELEQRIATGKNLPSPASAPAICTTICRTAASLWSWPL